MENTNEKKIEAVVETTIATGTAVKAGVVETISNGFAAMGRGIRATADFVGKVVMYSFVGLVALLVYDAYTSPAVTITAPADTKVSAPANAGVTVETVPAPKKGWTLKFWGKK